MNYCFEIQIGCNDAVKNTGNRWCENLCVFCGMLLVSLQLGQKPQQSANFCDCQEFPVVGSMGM